MLHEAVSLPVLHNTHDCPKDVLHPHAAKTQAKAMAVEDCVLAAYPGDGILMGALPTETKLDSLCNS